jgi:hypothetical protein
VKQYKCLWRGCDRQFARRYDMKKHQKVHTKEGPLTPADYDSSDSEDKSTQYAGSTMVSVPAPYMGGLTRTGATAQTRSYRSAPGGQPWGMDAGQGWASVTAGMDPRDGGSPTAAAYPGTMGMGVGVGAIGMGLGGMGMHGAMGVGGMGVGVAALSGVGGGVGGRAAYGGFNQQGLDAVYRIQAMRQSDVHTASASREYETTTDSVVSSAGGNMQGSDQDARVRKARMMDTHKGYTRVLHNTHVDMLSPTSVLECRESTAGARVSSLKQATRC